MTMNTTPTTINVPEDHDYIAIFIDRNKVHAQGADERTLLRLELENAVDHYLDTRDD